MRKLIVSLSRLRWKERITVFSMVSALVMCSGATGVPLGFAMAVRKHRTVALSKIMLAAAMPPAQIHLAVTASNADTLLAVDAVKLDEISKQNQQSVDDRHLLHDQLSALSNVETTHFNTLANRMDIDDAKVTTIGWVLGALFTFSQAVMLFFHLDKRFQQNRAKLQA